MAKKQISKEFTIQETNMAKGVACMLLLFHHLFYHESKFDLFWHLTNPPIISKAAVFGKVCVAIFLILICVVLSVLIEKLKVLVKFDKLQRFAINKLK